MGKYYNIEEVSNFDGMVEIKVNFGEPASNDIIVTEVSEMDLSHLNGKTCLINGPASLPVAFVLAHKLLHQFTQIGIFDPKMGGYVIVSSHGGELKVGGVIRR